VADQLRRALDEGRLTLLEYDQRLGSAYAAKTYGELAEVTGDLPSSGSSVPPDRHAASTEAAPAHSTRTYLVQQGRAWLGGAVVTNGIWAATSGFDLHHYWPGVVLPIWAIGILGRLVSGKHHHDRDKRARRGRSRQRDRPDRRARHDPGPADRPDQP
jgi:hypothetical protein